MARHLLQTDAEKFSMGEAGWPLRTETFYYHHRRGGPHYLPLDVAEYIRARLPVGASDDDWAYLDRHGYVVGGGFREAMRRVSRVEVHSLPPGSWFFDREPVFRVVGPSAVVSWLEPIVVRLNYRIQIATLALKDREAMARAVRRVVCGEQREIVLETLDQVGVPAPPIEVDEAAYMDAIAERMKKLVEIVGDPARIVEVGMRTASCEQHHALALAACKDEGLRTTSNVHLARRLGLRPAGAMAHEHVQRYGSDEAAFRAMRERVPGPSSFLLDTYSTALSGLPTALRLIEEAPERRDFVRYDSGDKLLQYDIACRMAKRKGLRVRHLVEDALDDEQVAAFEAHRERAGVRPEDQSYGLGGFLVNAPWEALTRNRVSAVYKLCQTGTVPTMKFADAPTVPSPSPARRAADRPEYGGKESIPGRPVLYRHRDAAGAREGQPVGLVAQEGEEVGGPWVRVTDAEPFDIGVPTVAPPRPLYSRATEALVQRLYQRRDDYLKRPRED